MKDTKVEKNRNITMWIGLAMAAVMIGGGVATDYAQNSLPAPVERKIQSGSGRRRMGRRLGPARFDWESAAATSCVGRPNPWGWSSSPTIVVNNPSWTNQGTVNVIACGYDNRGIWRTIPMYVAYVYNGAQYDATVMSAWNPWTDMWDKGLDTPAYNTSYYIGGNTYDFYTVLTTGTYYFNL